MNSDLKSQLTDVVACLYEGSAECAIIDILLENSLLVFSEEQLIDGHPLHCRNGQEFQSKYLRKEFPCKVSVIRILDSRKEHFKLSREYRNKVKLFNVVTAPEIEMLIILHENKYTEYKSKSSSVKPSEYCKQFLKLKNVKTYDFVKRYFSNPEDLIKAMKMYKQYLCNKKVQEFEYTLFDLLKRVESPEFYSSLI